MTAMKVEYVDHMGSDLSVVNAARVSMDKKSDWELVLTEDRQNADHELVLSKADQSLISYLARGCSSGDWDKLIQECFMAGTNLEEIEEVLHYVKKMPSHWTPFAHTAITLRMKAPVFIRTQCFKHKQGFVENEVSRRYVTSEPEFFVPDAWRKKAGNVKQGSSEETLPKPVFTEGYCICCGTRIESPVREQGGGRVRKYCSTKCKTKTTNAYRNPYKVVFDNAKARVKRRGRREWALDFDAFEFPTHCPYLGLELDYSYGKGSIKPYSPSFDRIDPSKDYIPGNVEIISHRANSMKNDADTEMQVKMAEAMLLRHKGYIPNYEHSPEGLNQKALNLYNQMIEAGYCAEQARMVLPQSMMTEWVWTGNLYSFANFYNSRSDAHAQKEIRDLAELVREVIEPLYPVSWKELTK